MVAAGVFLIIAIIAVAVGAIDFGYRPGGVFIGMALALSGYLVILGRRRLKAA